MFRAIIPVPLNRKAPGYQDTTDRITGDTGTGSSAQSGDAVNAGAIEGATKGATKGTKTKLAALLTAIARQEGQRAPAYKAKTGFLQKSLERYLSLLRNAGLIEFRGDAAQTGGYYLTEYLNNKLKNEQ